MELRRQTGGNQPRLSSSEIPISKMAGAPAIRLHPDDDAVIAARELAQGDRLPDFPGLMTYSPLAVLV